MINMSEFLELELSFFVFKEFFVAADSLAHDGIILSIDLSHEHGKVVGAVFFAEKPDVPEPVVLWLKICKGIVYEIVAFQIVVEQELFDGKAVAPRQLDLFHIGKLYLVKEFLKLVGLVAPEDYPPPVKFRQRRFKTLS